MDIIITSRIPAAVFLCGERFFFGGSDRTVFSLDSPQGGFSAAFIPSDPGGELLPSSARLGLRSGVFSGKMPAPPAPCRSLRAVRWAEDALELIPRFARLPSPASAPALLDRLELDSFGEDGARAEVSLFRDCGLRLAVERGGIETSYALPGGTDGSLSLLDIGSERLILVRAVGCAVEKSADRSILFYGSAAQNLLSPAPSERLFALDADFALVAEVEGERCFLADGYLTAVDRLGSVLGHERRRRYELFGRELSGEREGMPAPKETELGFFTAGRRAPKTHGEAALALLECVRLGREAEAFSLLAPELASGLDFAGLRAFFGEFDEARPDPRRRAEFEDAQSKTIAAGTVRNAEGCGEAGCYEFTVENGLIADVTEGAGGDS